MKYDIVTTTKFNDYAVELKNYLGDELSCESSLIVVEDDLTYVAKVVEISNQIAKVHREGFALIMIDETGALGFVASGKVKYMITAQCSDEHSAHMTREHNGAVGLALGANITAIPEAKLILKRFVEEKFAAGRHMVRIDMLDDMA